MINDLILTVVAVVFIVVDSCSIENIKNIYRYCYSFIFSRANTGPTIVIKSGAWWISPLDVYDPLLCGQVSYGTLLPYAGRWMIAKRDFKIPIYSRFGIGGGFNIKAGEKFRLKDGFTEVTKKYQWEILKKD